LLDVIAQAGSGMLQGVEQDEASASYQTWPAADELLVDRDWNVQRVLNFVIGIRPLGYEATISTTRGIRVVRSARASNQPGRRGEKWLDDRVVCMPVADGAVEFTV
jgi:hypothetical protein